MKESLIRYLFSKESVIDNLKSLIPFYGEIEYARKTKDAFLAMGEWLYWGTGRTITLGGTIGSAIAAYSSHRPEIYIITFGCGMVHLLLSSFISPAMDYLHDYLHKR